MSGVWGQTLMVSFDLATVALAFVFSFSITGLMIVYARRAKLYDVPNQRSSHSVPTPRGGGLGIVLVFLSFVALTFLKDRLPSDAFYALSVGGTIVAVIGFIDDHRHVPAKWRFLVQTVAAIFALYFIGGLPDIQVGSVSVSLGLPGDVLAVVFIVWLVNLYNFMDGIDGIAAAEAISVAGGASLLIATGSSTFIATLFFVFSAAALGFLLWNWPPAKIFMGDVASGFIGFVLAVFALISSASDLLPIWVWLILAGVFIVDATLTLITRVLRREQWYAAHNNHAYQKASRAMNGHRPVTLIVILINGVWLLPIAWWVSQHPDYGWWLTLVAWTPLCLLAMYMKAGHPDSEAG